jgi:imidazolonepropionase-like amidohydrolase
MKTCLRGAQVYDGNGGPPRQLDIVVEDGTISGLGAESAADRTIDLDGLSLIPGLIDSHVHVFMPTIDTMRLLNMPLTYRTFKAAEALGVLLDTGLTTVRDAAGADLGIKEAVEDGLVRGPAMQISVNMISTTGGHGDPWLSSDQTLRTLFPIYPGVPDSVADGPEGMRRLVRELVRNGADVVKVAVSGGVVSARDAPEGSHLRADEMQMIVAEAEAAGLAVMAHAHAAESVKIAVRAGVRSIEHGTLLDQEAAELMAERGAFLVPTLNTPRAFLKAAAAGGAVDPAMAAQAEGVLEAHVESFQLALELGIPIAMGTDSGLVPHGDNLDELEVMAESGMSREQCLVSATSRAAELLGLGATVGSIEVGKQADLVVVEGDPLDFATLRPRIRAVFKAGERVDRHGSLPGEQSERTQEEERSG